MGKRPSRALYERRRGHGPAGLTRSGSSVPPRSGKADPHQLRRWLIGLTSAVVTAALVAWATNFSGWLWNRLTVHKTEPLAVNTEREGSRVWAISGKLSPADLPPAREFGTWAPRHGGFHPNETVVYVTVQGSTSDVVVLTRMRVRVQKRLSPPLATVIDPCWMCVGAPQPIRAFNLDLDSPNPVLKPDPASRETTNFPYRVSNSDPEVFKITADTSNCDCRWKLYLDWASGGKSGSLTIDAGGQPFRTAAIREGASLCYDRDNPQSGYADTTHPGKAQRVCH